jgi:hypothetical protein
MQMQGRVLANHAPLPNTQVEMAYRSCDWSTSSVMVLLSSKLKIIVWSFRPGPGGYDHIFSPRTSPRSLQIRPAMSDRRLVWTKDEHSLLVKIRRELPHAKLEDLTDAFNKKNQQNTQRNKGERTPIAVRTKLRSLGLSNRSRCWCRQPSYLYQANYKGSKY